MFSYNLKLVVPENKLDEFMDTLRVLSSDVCEEEGYLDFSLYRNLQKKDVYSVFVGWKTRPAMEKHFKNNSFSVLVGAAKVLGRDFELSITETLEKGSYSLAKEKIALKLQESKLVDNSA